MIDGVKIKIDSTFKSVAEPSYQIIDGVKVRIDSTLKSVSYPAHVVVQEANKRLGSAVNTIEHVMDKYLPAETTTTTSTITNKNLDDTTTTTTTTTTTKTSPPHTHTEVDKDANQVKRAYGVIHEASRRIGHMVTTQVNLSTANIPKSREDITRLTETNSYIQTAASQIHVIQETLMNTVNVYGQAAQERLHLISETVQHTTLSMGQQMTHVTDYLQSHSRELPEYLRHGMDSLINNTHEQLDVVRGIYAREDINAFEKTKQVLHNIQTQFVPHLHEIQTQLITYTEVLRQAAEKEFRTPLHYLGLNQKVAA
ncbi:hypothetical protein BDB01DRAFT_784833 [Pilobolus umbonatus]|nr:hypothetical protein BDB01DRAFT_784833 [Pilobolus umbonatus]